MIGECTGRDVKSLWKNANKVEVRKVFSWIEIKDSYYNEVD